MTGRLLPTNGNEPLRNVLTTSPILTKFSIMESLRGRHISPLSSLLSRKHSRRKLSNVNIPDANITNGLPAKLKTVGTELKVNTILAALTARKMTSTGA